MGHGAFFLGERKATADPSTAIGAENAPISAQEDMLFCVALSHSSRWGCDEWGTGPLSRVSEKRSRILRFALDDSLFWLESKLWLKKGF